MEGAFGYYTLVWGLTLALLPAVLANIALVGIWIVRDAVDRKGLPLWKRKVKRKDVAGYELTGKDTFAAARLRWRGELGAAAACRLAMQPIPEKRCAFRTRVPGFDLHFAVREAPAETQANLWANEERLARAVPFLERWTSKIEDVTIEKGTISFEGKHGALPADALPGMIAFADAFWGAAAFPPLSDAPGDRKRVGDYRTPAAAQGASSWLVEVPLGEPLGPISTDQLVRSLYEGRVTPATRVAPEGTLQFERLGNTETFQRFFDRAAPAPRMMQTTASSGRQRVLWRLRRPHRHIVLAVSTLLAFSGAASLAKGKETWDLAVESVAWPTTEGVVVASRKACSSSGSGSNRRTSCSHEFKYAYEVAGRQHQGYRIRYGAVDERIETRVETYPVGARVQVSYRPSEPFESVIEPGTSHIEPLVTSYVPLLAGLGPTLLVGVWRLSVWWGAVRRWWRRRLIGRVVNKLAA